MKKTVGVGMQKTKGVGMQKTAQVGMQETDPPTDWLSAVAGDKPLFTREHRKRSGPFIKGPIPLHWAKLACREGAAELAIYIWWKVGLLSQGSEIALRPGELAKFGSGRYAIRRQYKALVAAGLVQAIQESGKCKAVRVKSRWRETVHLAAHS
jgi:hypothetical protein